MWHSDILKELDTLLLVRWGQIQSPPESLERMQVFCSQQTAWRKKKSPFTIPEPPSSCRQSCSHGSRSDEVSNISALQCWHVKLIGHLHIVVSDQLEAKPRISSFHPNWSSSWDSTQSFIWFSQDFYIYITTTFESSYKNKFKWLAMSVGGKTYQLERRGWKEGREKSYCGRTDVFLSPLDSFFITSLNF